MTQPALPASGSIQLARSIPMYGKPRNFQGPDAAERAYRFGMWFMAARGTENNYDESSGIYKRALRFCRDNGIVLRAMNEGSNEVGGFLVPEEFGNDLIDLREQYGVVRRNFRIVPMASDTRIDPRRAGGLTPYFAGEAETGTESDKTWGQISLTAKKLFILTRYSTELSEDSVINVADDLAGEIAYAFATKEDDCGFNGDATSTYGGMTGVTTKIKSLSGTIANIAGLQVATGTGYGSSYGSIVLTDFQAVAAKLPVYADTPRAKWYCHKSFYWNVMVKLALAAGGVTGAEIEGSRTKRFLGYDVEFVQVMPKDSAVSQVCALLGDFYLGASFGTRRDTRISISEHALFTSDQLQIRGTERFDVNVHDVGNANATANLRVAGPIVGLITAAS
jgi:HK97 family phage major capsid protein